MTNSINQIKICSMDEEEIQEIKEGMLETFSGGVSLRRSMSLPAVLPSSERELGGLASLPSQSHWDRHKASVKSG
jgi:hypothetical protein